MAKRKSKKQQYQREFVDIDFSHNTIRVLPFPPGMYEVISADIIKKYPEPDVPIIEIESFGGSKDKPETMENFDDPEYIKERDDILKLRENKLAELILQFILEECVEILDMEKMNKDILRLSKYTTYPEDEIEKIGKYITTYLLTSQNDYAKIITSSLKMTVAGDKEVSAKLDTFQDNL